MADVTIWHNPSCGSSKNALAYLQDKGIEPTIYLYLKEKPNKAAILALLKQAGLKASDLLRPGEKKGEELGLYAGATQTAILNAMVEHAGLIQRPVVITEKGAVIARPKTRIDEIL
jgi:arsenate reductase